MQDQPHLKTAQYIATLLLVTLVMLFYGCGNKATDCSAVGLAYYDGMCSSREIISFASCVKDRGKTVESNIEGKVSAAVKSVGRLAGVDGAVEVARKVTETENTSVALEIVKNCLKLAGDLPNLPQPVRASIQSGVQDFEARLREQCTGPEGGQPSIQLTPPQGAATTRIAVAGQNWPPNTEIEIRVATSKERATSNAQGRFTASISLPANFAQLARDGDTHTVIAQPVDLLIAARCPGMSTSQLFKVRR